MNKAAERLQEGTVHEGTVQEGTVQESIVQEGTVQVGTVQGGTVLEDIVQGDTVLGKRGTSRPRTTCIKQIYTELSGQAYMELRRLTQAKQQWYVQEFHDQHKG